MNLSKLLKCIHTQKDLYYCKISLISMKNKYNKLIGQYDETKQEFEVLRTQFGQLTSELAQTKKVLKKHNLVIV